MLKRLHLQNFTVFADADFDFGPGLNVLVGTNGTGKSHVLKLGYAVEVAYLDAMALKEGWMPSFELDSNINSTLENFLEGVFASKGLRNIVRRDNLLASNWPTEAKIRSEFGEMVDDYIEFKIIPSSSATHRVSVSSATHIGVVTPGLNSDEETGVPVFIPAKEMLSLMPSIVGLSSRYSDLLDLTYVSLAQSLLIPLLKDLPHYVTDISQQISSLLQGSIEVENGRFYIVSKQKGKLEISLVAEGFRKLATLIYLLANGSLSKNTTLYWDEPEANLNPALLRKLAAILAELARQGFQIIMATHSTDLLKEFHILSRQKEVKPLPIKYFGLNAESGEATRIVATDNFEHLPDVVALAEELKQADELEEIFIREDREYYANNRGEQPGI